MDAKCYFSYLKHPLNLLEAYHAVKRDNFEIISICGGIKFTLDDAFFMEHITNLPKTWYKRIMQVILTGPYYFCEDTPENRERVEGSHKDYSYLNEKDYRRMFYAY